MEFKIIDLHPLMGKCLTLGITCVLISFLICMCVSIIVMCLCSCIFSSGFKRLKRAGQRAILGQSSRHYVEHRVVLAPNHPNFTWDNPDISPGYPHHQRASSRPSTMSLTSDSGRGSSPSTASSFLAPYFSPSRFDSGTTSDGFFFDGYSSINPNYNEISPLRRASHSASQFGPYHGISTSGSGITETISEVPSAMEISSSPQSEQEEEPPPPPYENFQPPTYAETIQGS